MFSHITLNDTLRRIVIATGEVITPGTRGSANGIETAARFNDHIDSTTDGFHQLVADQLKHLNNSIHNIE